jgi:hypothetical protein
MTKLNATYNGQVLRHEEPLLLSPNTLIGLNLEPTRAESTLGEVRCFFGTARTLKLEGPPDWSSSPEDPRAGAHQSTSASARAWRMPTI